LYPLKRYISERPGAAPEEPPLRSEAGQCRNRFADCFSVIAQVQGQITGILPRTQARFPVLKRNQSKQDQTGGDCGQDRQADPYQDVGAETAGPLVRGTLQTDNAAKQQSQQQPSDHVPILRICPEDGRVAKLQEKVMEMNRLVLSVDKQRGQLRTKRRRRGWKEESSKSHRLRLASLTTMVVRKRVGDSEESSSRPGHRIITRRSI
jgi:hypothetical protein